MCSLCDFRLPQWCESCALLGFYTAENPRRGQICFFFFAFWVIYERKYRRHCLSVILLGNVTYITVRPLNPSNAWNYRIQCAVVVIYTLLFYGRILIPNACSYFKKRNLLVGLFSAHLEVKLWLIRRIAVAAGTWIVCFTVEPRSIVFQGDGENKRWMRENNQSRKLLHIVNTWCVQVLRSPNLLKKKLLITGSWKCSHFST